MREPVAIREVDDRRCDSLREETGTELGDYGVITWAAVGWWVLVITT